MKRVEEHPPQTSVMVYRVLLVVAGVLVFILIAGTIYGLVKRGKTAGPLPVPETSVEEALFSGLGTMRIPTADPEPETLIIRIAFHYNKNDKPFSEELVSRISAFKTTTSEYLGAFTGEEITDMDTDMVKTELLKRYNTQLSLGKIKELFILDFMLL